MKFATLCGIARRDKFGALAVLCLMGCGVMVASCTIGQRTLESTEPETTDATIAIETTTLRSPATRSTTEDNDSGALPSTTSPIATENEQARAEDQETGVQSHTVSSGDTLTRIADRYNVSIASLLAANDLPNPNLLEVGQIIILPQVPVDYTPAFRILPDARLVRSIKAADFDTAAFIQSQNGALRRLSVHLSTRQPDGSQKDETFSASQIVERVSLEYSVDSRVLLAFLEHFAGFLSAPSVDRETELYPLLSVEDSFGIDRAGLYNQLSWLADNLNLGFYDWKYRNKRILNFPDGTILSYERTLNAGTVGVQYALAQLQTFAAWESDVSEAGFFQTYRGLFDSPFVDDYTTVPSQLTQPPLTLPFAPGEVWRFTGGFHGGWGNGSAWAAVDFSPPEEAGQGGYCYISSFPATAVATGVIARLAEGLVVLDLDGDGNEGSGWTILYLHLNPHDALRVSQTVEVGNIIGYPSCLGGFTTATHLHIARRYNGEWIPADCNRCPAGVDVPPLIMSNWRVAGLGSQLYQGFLVHELDNRTAIAEQGRFTDINEISW